MIYMLRRAHLSIILPCQFSQKWDYFKQNGSIPPHHKTSRRFGNGWANEWMNGGISFECKTDQVGNCTVIHTRLRLQSLSMFFCKSQRSIKWGLILTPYLNTMTFNRIKVMYYWILLHTTRYSYRLPRISQNGGKA